MAVFAGLSQFIVLQSIQLFCSGLRARNKSYKIYDCFVIILKKKENSLDTRYNSYKFRYFRFLALQKLQNLRLKQPLNGLNSTL